VVPLNDWYWLAKVQLLPAIGSAAGSIADAPAVLEDRGTKSLQEQSLVFACISLQLLGTYCVDYVKLQVL
jgi:hypothetical protein